METGCGKKLAVINTDMAAIKEKFYVQVSVLTAGYI